MSIFDIPLCYNQKYIYTYNARTDLLFSMKMKQCTRLLGGSKDHEELVANMELEAYANLCI